MNSITCTIFILLWTTVKCDLETIPMENATEIEMTEKEPLHETSTTETPIHQTTLPNITTTTTTTTTMTTTTTTTTTTTAPIPFGEYWMMKMGEITEDLLRIQAIIVKDDEIDRKLCTEGQQKSKYRYLMCAGSILNRNRVLTTASCIHEAMHIRHNVRAPLAVVIAPLRSTVQIIKVADYKIHPRHNSNPHSRDHAKHNLAILSLACRISTKNYYKVQLPTKAMAGICTEENCFITILRRAGYTSNVMFQIPAPQMLNDRRRRSVSYEEDSSSQIDGSNGVRKISKRSTDGVRSCSQTGAPVMINSTQVAIVAVSCDDRQPSGKWLYSDLFPNAEWIHGVLEDWNKTEPTTPPPLIQQVNNSRTSKSCGNCIFNFYISVGCKEKGNCPKGGNEAMNNTAFLIPHENLNIPRTREYPQWNPDSTDNDIARPYRSSFNKCPDNSPACLMSSNRVNGAQRLVPVQRIHPDLISMNRKIGRLANDPIGVVYRNKSRINDVGMYNVINRKYEEIQKMRGRPLVLRKFDRPSERNKQKMYVLKKPLNEKLVERNNWLRRHTKPSYRVETKHVDT